MSEAAPSGLRGIVVRGAGLAASGYALQQVLNLGAYLVLARLVAPQEYGVYAAGSLVAGVGLLLSGSGIQAALVQRRDRFEEAASTAVLSSFAAGLGFGLLALATAPLVGLFFDDHRVGLVAAALAGWIPLRSLAVVPDAVMQRRFSFLRRVVCEPVGVLLFGATAITGAALGLGAWALVIGTYVSAVARLVLTWGLARWRPDRRLMSWAMWLELARFGRHVLASEVLRRYTSEMPSALVGRFVGIAALGQFTYGQRFGMQPQAAVTNVASFALLPAFARIADDPERLRRAFLRALRWITALAVPAGFLLLPLGEPLAVVLLGERWALAGQVMMALCAYPAARCLVSIASEVFKATARPDLLPRMHLLSAVATTAAVVALLPLGAAGVAAGVTASSVVVAAYAVRAVSPLVGVPLARIARTLAPPLLGSLALVAVVWPLDRLVLDAGSRDLAPGLALVAAAGLAGLLAYAAVLGLAAPELARELRQGLGSARTRRAPTPVASAGRGR